MFLWSYRNSRGNLGYTRKHEVQVFPRNFVFFPNFHKCFHNSIGTRKRYLLFPVLHTFLKTKKDKFIEFNHIYSNVNINLYLVNRTDSNINMDLYLGVKNCSFPCFLVVLLYLLYLCFLYESRCFVF